MTKTLPSPLPFVSVDHMMQLVHHIGIDTMLSGITEYLEQDFKRWPDFDKAPRIASHSADGVIELMPTSDGELYSFKYVNGHPKNTKEGLQTVTAFGLLADVSSGYPVLLSEMTLLTALRTAATSALVAKHLAPAKPNCMALIGNGAQSEFQALAMRSVCGVTKLRLYDIDPSATTKTYQNLRDQGFEIIRCTSGEEAVQEADIITTCTADKQYATILTDNMVGAGIHINAIGGDCPGKTEVHQDILSRSDVFVEYIPQTRIEGEIQQMPDDFPVTEIWQVITGICPGRTSDDQITLFDGVGFAIEDYAALRYVRHQLQQTGLYQQLDMIADPNDPRDLFGMLQRRQQAHKASNNITTNLVVKPLL